MNENASLGMVSHWHVVNLSGGFLIANYRFIDAYESIDFMLGYANSYSLALPEKEEAKKMMILAQQNPGYNAHIISDETDLYWFPCIECYNPLEN